MGDTEFNERKSPRILLPAHIKAYRSGSAALKTQSKPAAIRGKYREKRRKIKEFSRTSLTPPAPPAHSLVSRDHSDV